MLRDYTNHIPTNIGFLAENDKQLFDAAFLSRNVNKYVMLMIDEMHIKHDLVYKYSGSLIGYVNLGNVNNQNTGVWKGIVCWEH